MSLLLLFGGVAPTGVTGTSATTNANDTSSASGKVTIVGTSATTNAADSSTAAGKVTIAASSATTNANDTASASGTVTNTVTGSSATTNANDTTSTVGTVTITGVSATTNANDTSSASGDSGTPSPTADTTHTGLRPRQRRRPEPQLPILLPPVFAYGDAINTLDFSTSNGLVDPYNVFLEDEELLLLV